MTLRIAFFQTVLLENCVQGNKVQETLTFLFLSTPWYTITQCVALTLAFLCGLGAKNQERESKTARKVFWHSFHFSRGQNRMSPSSVFLCSKTKRKRLLRGLCVTGLALALYGVFPCLLGQCIRQGSRLKGKEKYIRHASKRDNRETQNHAYGQTVNYIYTKISSFIPGLSI